jgi:medium-chain acyl-[acyl-carrier-protein] hydrolase
MMKPSGSEGSLRAGQATAPVPLSEWIVRPLPVANPRLRLFCFPHAGRGASMFRNWPTGLSDKIEVCAIQPPGREDRLDDCPYARIDTMVQTATDQLRPWLKVPFALFGHELGAIIAFEVARRLQKVSAPAPVRLIVAGRPAPHLPTTQAAIHHLSDNEFLDRLTEGLAAIPDSVRRNRDLLARILPGLRADFTMLETYAYRSADRLTCPITALAGAQDPTVTAESLAAWTEHTSTFSQQVFPGDQHFLHLARSEVLAGLSSLLLPDYQ